MKKECEPALTKQLNREESAEIYKSIVNEEDDKMMERAHEVDTVIYPVLKNGNEISPYIHLPKAIPMKKLPDSIEGELKVETYLFGDKLAATKEIKSTSVLYVDTFKDRILKKNISHIRSFLEKKQEQRKLNHDIEKMMERVIETNKFSITLYQPRDDGKVLKRITLTLDIVKTNEPKLLKSILEELDKDELDVERLFELFENKSFVGF